MIRIGMGFDVHRLVEGRDLWLGGIKIEHTLGLLGHSDADVLIHAICDALLGAANMRDIGYHFPDTGIAKFFCVAPPNSLKIKGGRLAILTQPFAPNARRSILMLKR